MKPWIVIVIGLVLPFALQAPTQLLQRKSPAFKAQPNGLLTGLTAYWKLDETSPGTNAVTRNDSFGANHLTDNNTVPSVTGLLNNCCDFEFGNVESLSRADNADLSVGTNVSFSFSTWVNLESDPAGGESLYIVSKDNNTTTTREHSLLWANAANRFQWVVGRSGSTTVDFVSADTFGAISLATWYHVVGVFDASNDTLKIYVNTVSDTATGKTIDPPDGTATFYIGNIQHTSRPFDGKIDEVGFWKKALTADDVSTLYNGGTPLPYSSFN